MKVTFTCEKCGTVLDEKYVQHHVTTVTFLTPDPCPNCSRLRYGPLTEEMVAEALDEVWRRGYVGEVPPPPFPKAGEKTSLWTYHQARFVLRLLHEVGEHKGLLPAVGGDFPESYRDWLLDLARQP